MLRCISDMPAGTIGLEVVGEVEDDDWDDVVEPVLRRELADGRHVRRDVVAAVTGFRARHAII